MNVAVRDAQVLKAVTPLELTTFLRASGWNATRQIGDKATVWQLSKDNDDYELLTPARRDLGDYSARVFDVLEILSQITGRSHLQLLFDFSVTNTDVVRVRAISSSVEDGTIGLREGADLIQHSKEMMLAAASSTVQKQSVFLTRKPERAVEYLDKVRLGQTEHGSFILTLLSPVAPATPLASLFGQAETNPAEAEEAELPFERQVTELLSRSLGRVQRAAVSAATTGTLDSFKDAVDDGVTSNLCEALVGLHESGGQKEVEVSFSWSRGRTAPANVPASVHISSEIISVVREAAKMFRETAPAQPVVIQGYVAKLSRPQPNARGGEITIHGFIDREVRKVRVALAHDDYQEAVVAHERYKPVACRGELVKSGSVFRFLKPDGFTVLSAVDFDAGAFERRQINLRLKSRDQIALDFEE